MERKNVVKRLYSPADIDREFPAKIGNSSWNFNKIRAGRQRFISGHRKFIWTQIEYEGCYPEFEARDND